MALRCCRMCSPINESFASRRIVAAMSATHSRSGGLDRSTWETSRSQRGSTHRGSSRSASSSAGGAAVLAAASSAWSCWCHTNSPPVTTMRMRSGDRCAAHVQHDHSRNSYLRPAPVTFSVWIRTKWSRRSSIQDRRNLLDSATRLRTRHPNLHIPDLRVLHRQSCQPAVKSQRGKGNLNRASLANATSCCSENRDSLDSATSVTMPSAPRRTTDNDLGAAPFTSGTIW